VGDRLSALGQFVGDVRPAKDGRGGIWRHRSGEALCDLASLAIQCPSQLPLSGHLRVWLLGDDRCGTLTPMTTTRLASYERRYRDLARQLSEIGWIASGSLARRPERCSKASCACHSDPARLHGPYWHFTAKVAGRTVNKRLSEREAHLYQQWIANDRAMSALLAEMRAIASDAQALILAEETSKPPRQEPCTTSPETRRATSRRSG
jgi:hypothetical protein